MCCRAYTKRAAQLTRHFPHIKTDNSLILISFRFLWYTQVQQIYILTPPFLRRSFFCKLSPPKSLSKVINLCTPPFVGGDFMRIPWRNAMGVATTSAPLGPLINFVVSKKPGLTIGFGRF